MEWHHLVVSWGLAQVLSQGGAVGGPGEPLGSLWDGVPLGACKGAGFSESLGLIPLAAPRARGQPGCIPAGPGLRLPRLVMGGGERAPREAAPAIAV